MGQLFDRRKEAYTALALSAFVLLVMNPRNLFDIGFQLSFSATYGLLYIAPVLEKRMPALLAFSLAPIMATSPLVAFYFGQISPGAIVANLLVLPWMECMVILGFSTALLGFVFLPPAQILGGTLYLLLWLLDSITNAAAAIPGAWFYVAAPSPVFIFIYYAVLAVLVEVMRKEKKIKITFRRAAFVVLFLLSFFLWDRIASATIYGARELAVTFLDVGQGDSTLIEAPDGKKILIDGGGMEGGGGAGTGEGEGEGIGMTDRVGKGIVLPFLHRKGINRLDLVILTHPHADHLGGLNEVLEEIKVDQVLDNGQTYDSDAYRRFRSLIEANKIKYSAAQAGQVIDFGGNLKGFVLNPIYPPLNEANSDSVVMRLVYGNISFLFTGDAGKETEERMLQLSGCDLHSKILKVGHHGGEAATSDEFLKAVAPETAVISAGRHNRYRHPHASTFIKLAENGVKIYRTDENGTVTVRTDGREAVIESRK
ncbi:DNA internalization-related competence protein ComEC/Rec2 [Candidatus Saganbacteria bacterium]|uniref:DNA internalization-related competence protein ComEC/Rec2 n=1 Tax=Candidatus Saganbacteria bacterium TaxID=2575572 RepID=A0A9D6YXX4_UNCSA|nr:DNA internalization-related competence protein ComEC/Rec2 [Candidatus Saganbacteria bacterium]